MGFLISWATRFVPGTVGGRPIKWSKHGCRFVYWNALMQGGLIMCCYKFHYSLHNNVNAKIKIPNMYYTYFILILLIALCMFNLNLFLYMYSHILCLSSFYQNTEQEDNLCPQGAQLLKVELWSVLLLCLLLVVIFSYYYLYLGTAIVLIYLPLLYCVQHARSTKLPIPYLTVYCNCIWHYF